MLRVTQLICFDFESVSVSFYPLLCFYILLSVVLNLSYRYIQTSDTNYYDQLKRNFRKKNTDRRFYEIFIQEETEQFNTGFVLQLFFNETSILKIKFFFLYINGSKI